MAAIAELRALERAGEYGKVAAGLRKRVESDPRTLTGVWAKDWCGRRWRDLFLTAALEDPIALAEARRRPRLRRPGTKDTRPDRHKLAERYLHRNAEEWDRPLGAWRPRKPRRTAVVLCPGLVSTLIPVPALGDELPAVGEALGWETRRASAHPMRSCEANTPDLLEAIEARPRRDVVLIGYSKGAPDALTLLAAHPELGPRISAIVCWAGAVGGSHAADPIYAAVKDVEIPASATGPLQTLVKALLPVARVDGLGERLDEYDVKGALRDLTTTERARFLKRHGAAIDRTDVPIFNLSAVAGPLEVPYFQLQGQVDIARREGDNDMQLSVAQSRMTTPMATDLAVLHGHHWDISYGPFPKRSRLGAANLDHRFPRAAALTATLQLLTELGLAR